MSIATTWGTDAHERSLPFPCDRYLVRPAAAYYRGVTIDAPPPVIFRWLCQMRVAPYSYDWIDNLGRRSPQALTPGLDALAIGQRFMSFFELADFEKDRQLTFRTIPNALGTRIFGEQAGTYLIVPQSRERCRLLVKYVVCSRRGPIGWLTRLLLPWGDLVMMRRQLLNFKRLAESAKAQDEDAKEVQRTRTPATRWRPDAELGRRAGLLAAGLLTAAVALHLYWAVGGEWGLNASLGIERAEDRPLPTSNS